MALGERPVAQLLPLKRSEEAAGALVVAVKPAKLLMTNLVINTETEDKSRWSK